MAIRLYLASVNESQESLAKKWQCSKSTVSRFLAGKEMPSALTMLRIVTWLLETERPTHDT
jgi:transcriptional regulator with XRE-family HTH domain